MKVDIDFERLDLRSALDLAIGIEEDEQLRYREFAATVEDPGVAAFFRELTDSESHDRRRLEGWRDVLFRHDMARFDTSLADEEPERPDAGEALSAREALERSLRAELQAFRFYSAAIPHLRDADVRASFEELQRHTAEHHASVRRRLEGLRR